MSLSNIRKIEPSVEFDSVPDLADWCSEPCDRTFYFKTQSEFTAAIFILHNHFTLRNPLEIIKHEGDHADAAKRWGLGHYFKLELICTDKGRIGLKPGVVQLIGHEVDDRTYAFLSYIIALAPEHPSDDDLTLARKMKQIMQKHLGNH